MLPRKGRQRCARQAGPPLGSQAWRGERGQSKRGGNGRVQPIDQPGGSSSEEKEAPSANGADDVKAIREYNRWASHAN